MKHPKLNTTERKILLHIPETFAGRWIDLKLQLLSLRRELAKLIIGR